MDKHDVKLLPLAAVGICKGIFEVYVEPVIQETRPSTKAWAALVGGVILYDALCPRGETLSEGYDSFIDRHPAVAWAATALTAAHLLNIIPETIDPIHRLANHGRA